MASCKLRHYFEAHKVRVISDRGLGELLRNPKASARIIKWAAELSGYNITFEPRTLIKSPSRKLRLDMAFGTTAMSCRNRLDHPLWWGMVSRKRRRCNNHYITAGLKYRYVAHLSFALESDKCTNNIVEYEAVILGLRKVWALGVTTCIIKTDSKVVADQIEKDYSTKELVLMQYLAAIQSLEKQFKGFTLQHIEKNKNEEADTLAKATAKGEPLPSDVFYYIVSTRAVRNPEGLQITQDADCDGTSQGIRPAYRCPCPKDLRQSCRCA
jgi:ribonuclease HI